MMHNGCLFYGFRSHCVDDAWTMSNWSCRFFVFASCEGCPIIEVEYHKRMDLMTSMGLLTVFQLVQGLIKICNKPNQRVENLYPSKHASRSTAVCK